ncbi:hypothetical protein BKA66DRAFT_453924 [Pyrenochaeta sp. MPI-SDFR-AT-0127]|nr:hypothetical protein BKA66DRAFT_453924 [Pyrenochaeta sp. MPI-SDFR-AT-0127]
MATTATNYTDTSMTGKPETAKEWLQRHLRKAASRQYLGSTKEDSSIQQQASLQRPQTAPSSGTATDPHALPSMPLIPIHIEHASPSPSIQPPYRPARPNSGMVRDVNAWLDASMSTPSPPLMGGLPYWRAATVAGVKDSAHVQHAIPIAREPEADRPPISNSRQLKSFRRRAKKIQVQMPSLLRTKSQCHAGRRHMEIRSTSTPLLATSNEETRLAGPPKLLTQTRSVLRLATRPATANASPQSTRLMSASEHPFERLPLRRETPASTRLDDRASNFERRFVSIFKTTSRGADSARPSTATASLVRENSLGDLSDAPTYFTGPRPPSYRSRTVSILTTSSFGCVDGMNPAQRQISQQRAALRRGMRGKLRRFAQNFKT